MTYDLLLKGGTLIDPSQGIRSVKDIAFDRGSVLKVADDLPVSDAKEVLNCSGRYVTPGLVDLHVHVFRGVSHYGIEADPHCVGRGVTTAVDAGSAGADTFQGFRKYVLERAATRLFAFLNISSIGMISKEVGELSNIEYANVSKAVAAVEENRDVILGIKVRLTPRHSGISRSDGLKPLYLAREVSDAVGLPIMVHPQIAWCNSIDDILCVLRERDIVTHCFHAYECGILDGNGKVRQSVVQAMERGVIFDVGHGVGSFSWDICERSLQDGFYPQTISSDLHAYDVNGPVYDLATTVSKFLCLGLSLDEAFEKVTHAPASAIGLSDKIGTLKPGASGDAIVFDLDQGDFKLWDSHSQFRIGQQRLTPTAIVREGKVSMRIGVDG